MEPRIHWARTTVTMSSDFIDHVYKFFFDSLASATSRTSGYARQGRNFYAPASAPAYLAAVAAVEAFVNEVFLSEAWIGGAPITVVSPESLERMNIAVKARDQQPYQDFVLLTKVRNELVHYKMGWAPKFVRILAQRGIAFRVEPEAEKVGGGIAWGHRLSTTEGIRWAHNTAVEVVQAMARLFPDDSPVRRIGDSWPIITDAMLEARLRELGVDT